MKIITLEEARPLLERPAFTQRGLLKKKLSKLEPQQVLLVNKHEWKMKSSIQSAAYLFARKIGINISSRKIAKGFAFIRNN